VPDPSTGVLMFVAYRAIEQRVLTVLREAGFDVTQAQGRVFARLGPDGTRLTDLAEMAQVSKQTAGFLVDQLEKGGYVERTSDPGDARARLIRIAERGRRVQALAAEVEQQVYREWRDHLGADELEHLRRSLVRLREVTDPYAE
jgi:DNA-binding MarR family transcriptional regulator